MASVPTAGDRDSAETLVARAVQGDEAAFARIVRLHRAAMVQVCYVIAGDMGVADAAVAAAWSVAWRRLGTLRHRDRLRPWLCSVAAGEARRIVAGDPRRGVATPTWGEAPAVAGPDVAGPTLDPAMATALAGLAPEDRALLVLRYVAGLGPMELDRAGVTPPAGARPRLDQLMDRLRVELPPDELPPDEQDMSGLEATFARRLRAFAAIQVASVDVDAVARAAHNERVVAQTHLVSVAVAALIAALFMAAAYVIGSGIHASAPAPTASATSVVSVRPAGQPRVVSPGSVR